MSHFFRPFIFDPCRENKHKLSHIIFLIVVFLTKICARSHKLTQKNATSKEVNTPISQKNVGCVSLSIEKFILFLKFLEFNSVLN